MKKTIELIDEQHAAQVQLIQFLDRHGHSDELYRDSEMELTKISLK